MDRYELYSKAANILRDGGWTQGSYGFANGPHCAVGSLLAANDWKMIDGAIFTEVAREALGWRYFWRRFIRALLFVEDVKEGSLLGRLDGAHIARWNDSERRKKADVIAVFDRLAQKYAPTSMNIGPDTETGIIPEDAPVEWPEPSIEQERVPEEERELVPA